MNIEREYKLTLEDQLNFQQYQLKVVAKKHPWFYPLRWLLIVYSPLFYIIFSSYFIFDHVVRIIGLIITICLIIYHLLINLFSRRINNNYLKKTYYNKGDISENVRIIITENSITDYSQFSEHKIMPQWVNEYQENKDYIYLINISRAAMIIPKKYFSDDEIEMIKKYYEK